MNALAPISDAAELETIQRTARLLAVSSFFDSKGDSPVAIAQIATKILAGRELGFGPFAAVNGIHIINGKPAVGANLMASAVKASGRYDYRVRKMADDEVVIEFFAIANGKLEPLGTSSFSMRDAQTAQVTGSAQWKKFPRNMLFARAMSNGVRWYCPDVFSGNAVYVPEELGAETDADGNVVETTGRVVDVATGEITPVANDVESGMGQDETPAEPKRAPKATLSRLHALGRRVYGDGWDAKRPELVRAVTRGAAESASALTPEQAQRIIAGLEARAAEQTPHVDETDDETPFG